MIALEPDLLFIFIAAALLVIAVITLTNVLMFPRLRLTRSLGGKAHFLPRVSVLIPARNEATVIKTTLENLLAQDYPDFEVLLLDDNSDDGTGEIARSVNHPQLTVLSGAPLPDGWLGKNWACHQLALEAQGEILIFADADVRWNPGALRALIKELERTHADLLTVWPTQQTESWPERLIVPLMALAIVGYLPIIGTHFTRFRYFAAACGQCMAWRREAYYLVGGHSTVRDNVLEDVTLARYTKRAGLRLRMADGAGLIMCRMYQDWPSVRDGFAKNILAGYGNSVPALLLSTLFHWALFVLPWLWLLFGSVIRDSNIMGWPTLPLLCITLGSSVRMMTAAFTRQRVLDGLLMPVSVVLMTIIGFRSIYWHQRLGGSSWKGRVIKKAKPA